MLIFNGITIIWSLGFNSVYSWICLCKRVNDIVNNILLSHHVSNHWNSDQYFLVGWTTNRQRHINELLMQSNNWMISLDDWTVRPMILEVRFNNAKKNESPLIFMNPRDLFAMMMIIIPKQLDGFLSVLMALYKLIQNNDFLLLWNIIETSHYWTSHSSVLNCEKILRIHTGKKIIIFLMKNAIFREQYWQKRTIKWSRLQKKFLFLYSFDPSLSLSNNL